MDLFYIILVVPYASMVENSFMSLSLSVISISSYFPGATYSL